jgi:hypothetical protein
MHAASDAWPQTLSLQLEGVHALAGVSVRLPVPFGVLVPHVGLPLRCDESSSCVRDGLVKLEHPLVEASNTITSQLPPPMPM